jgi:hypothetical protein
MKLVEEFVVRLRRLVLAVDDEELLVLAVSTPVKT